MAESLAGSAGSTLGWLAVTTTRGPADTAALQAIVRHRGRFDGARCVMRGLDRRLSRETSAARTHVALTVGLGLMTAVAVVAQAALLAFVIDRVVMRGESLRGVRAAIIALLLVAFARAVTAGVFEASGRLTAVRAMSELRGRLTVHLLRVRPGQRDGERTGEVAANAIAGVDALQAYFAGYLPQLVLACVVPVAVLGMAVRVDPVGGGILALTVPLLVLFMVLIGMGAQAATRRRWVALSLLSSHFVDVVGGLATLRAYRRDGAQKSILAEVGEAYRRETMGTLRIAFLSAFALELVAMMGTALVAVTVGIELLRGELGLQAGLTVLLLAPELYAPLRGVGQQFHASADGVAVAGRIFEVLDEPAELRSAAKPRQMPDLDRAAIRLEGVCFAYPRRDGQVLSGVDLELAPGSFTALVGANGAGKSTIVKLLLRLADPTAGRVSCAGVDLRDVDAEQWRSQIAWVPQRARLFAGSVAENIRLGAPHAAQRDVVAAARAAGAIEFITALPNGFETTIGDGGRRLSAGQGQRIAVARAFLRDAPLLVLDEPSANLDVSMSESLGEMITRLAVGRTTLLIAHRPALAARAHRIVKLDAGRIVPNDVVSNLLVRGVCDSAAPVRVTA